ncbi:glycosyltransferase [Phormidesmis priestleyi]
MESVLNQTWTDFEYLIWDNGSSDRSLEIAQDYARQDARIRAIAAPPQGLVRSLRSAIAATTGAYLGWVDSDDRLAPTALQETIAILEAAPSVGMTQYHVIDEKGTDQGLGDCNQIPYSPDQLLVNFMTFHFWLLRRTVYDQIGGIDVSYDRVEDYDLCLRLSKVTDIQQIPKPLYFFGNMGTM